jgi:hypothetical protein
MRILGFGKKPISAELAGRNLIAMMTDADDCWRDVCELRSYKTSGPIATCEVAFARAALVKSILASSAAPSIAERALRAADEMIEEAFSDQDTDDTLKFFDDTLSVAAKRRVSFYGHHVFPTSQLASVLGARLGVPGIPSVEAAPIFDRIEARMKSVLKDVKLI